MWSAWVRSNIFITLLKVICNDLFCPLDQFSSVQSLSHVWLFATPWTAACQASLSITNSRSPFKHMSIESWCHRTISSSVVPFSSCPQSVPAPGSFEMSQLFASGGQSLGVSASTSVLSMNTQDWSPLGWPGYYEMPSKQRTTSLSLPFQQP